LSLAIRSMGVKPGALVCDSQGREGPFDGNPLWAQGLGWALFNADDPKTMSPRVTRRTVRNCHIAAEKSDRVFIQGYPILGSDNRDITSCVEVGSSVVSTCGSAKLSSLCSIPRNGNASQENSHVS